MLPGKKVVAVLPAYKAEATLERTYSEIPHEIVDEVLLVDDASNDGTVRLAAQLGIETFVHASNLGYGANQKTCYARALAAGADIIVMVHPDYQYDPRLITAMAAMVASDVYDVVLGSRILGNTARRGGMPLYKFVANRILTAFENVLLGTKLSEFHTGYRAFARQVLEELPLLGNSDDFVFDNEILAQAVAFAFSIGEISCPTRYFPEASSINFRRSIKYGLGVLTAATKVEPRLLEKIYATCGEVGERDSNVEQGVSRWIHLTSVGIPQLLPQTGAAESTAGDRQ
jgi:glycosyltransferase involved in cell wall biosynthesis